MCDEVITVFGSDFIVSDSPFGGKQLKKYVGNARVVTIPEGICSVESQVFAGMDFIDTVILPSTLKTVGWGAFQDSSLVHIVLPASVYLVGTKAFAGCKKLKTVEIHNPRITFSRTPFLCSSDEFEIIFHGSMEEFKSCAIVSYDRDTYQSGDYYHPTSTQFEYGVYESRTHLFSSDENTPFTCTVRCADGELVYHEMPFESRRVKVQ